MPAPTGQVRPEEFRRGPAPGCAMQKSKESVAPMPVLGGIKRRTTIYPWSVPRPADASTRPCFAAISLPTLPTLPNWDRPILARYSVVEVSLGAQFARLLLSRRPAADRLQSRGGSLLRKRLERIIPSLGQGEFSRTSTATAFGRQRPASYSVKTNTLTHADHKPIRPFACSENEGDVCPQRTALGDFSLGGGTARACFRGLPGCCLERV